MTSRRLTALAALAVLCACVASPADRVDGEPWRGEVASYVVDRGERSEIEHRLRDPDGTVRRLTFARPVVLTPGSHLRVWGTVDGDEIRVREHEVDDVPIATVPSALIAGQPKPTRRWAFVLVDIDGGGNPVDKVRAQDALFNAARVDSIRSYFREVSYGVQDLEGEVLGPIAYKMDGRCDTDRLAAALVPQIAGRFDQYLWFFGTRQAACKWAGLADLGRADKPTRHSWYNLANTCNVLVQEPGHNFGMVHSSAMRCTRAGKPVPIAWPSDPLFNCVHDEYGNPFDPMGGGDCYHMNGVQKAYQDWLGGCNVVKATASGIFTIYPLESACDGPQLLQIPFGAPRMFGNAGFLTGYYLELRAPVGYRDRELDPQVLVIVANDVREAKFTGNNNWLLDMTPETEEAGDGALLPGKTFEDTLPGGPKFTVLSVDATKAVIQVELKGKAAEPGVAGTGVCSDLKEYQATAPVKCIAPPTVDAGPSPPPSADAGVADARAGAAADAAADADAGEGGKGGQGGGGGKAGTGRTDARTGTGGGGGSTAAADPEPTMAAAGSSGGCQVAPTASTGAAPLLLGLCAAARIRRRRARITRDDSAFETPSSRV